MTFPRYAFVALLFACSAFAVTDAAAKSSKSHSKLHSKSHSKTHSKSPAKSNGPAVNDPQSQSDKTSYRFNMQNGMTAAEFETWMKANGLHVAKGAPAAAGQTQPSTPATDAQPHGPAPDKKR